MSKRESKGANNDEPLPSDGSAGNGWFRRAGKAVGKWIDEDRTKTQEHLRKASNLFGQSTEMLNSAQENLADLQTTRNNSVPLLSRASAGGAMSGSASVAADPADPAVDPAPAGSSSAAAGGGWFGAASERFKSMLWNACDPERGAVIGKRVCLVPQGTFTNLYPVVKSKTADTITLELNEDFPGVEITMKLLPDVSPGDRVWRLEPLSLQDQSQPDKFRIQGLLKSVLQNKQTFHIRPVLFSRGGGKRARSHARRKRNVRRTKKRLASRRTRTRRGR